MRMYLSSFRLGNHPDHLVRLVGEGGPVMVVANGLDGEDAAVRADRVREELLGLQQIGVGAEELDLRQFIDRPEELEHRLGVAAAVWLRGGNLFLMRALLARTGADQVITHLVEADRLVLAGYSVAPAIVGPSLRGFERVDDPEVVARLTGTGPVWEGLGLVDQVVVPHCHSPHPASHALGQLADDLVAQGRAVARLRDGQALVIEGPSTFVV